MIPKNKVEDLILKHSSLEKELSSGKIDKKNFAERSKDYSDLNEIIKEIKEYNSFEKDQKDLKKIINDINNTELLCKKNPQISNSIFFNFLSEICKKANSFS